MNDWGYIGVIYWGSIGRMEKKYYNGLYRDYIIQHHAEAPAVQRRTCAVIGPVEAPKCRGFGACRVSRVSQTMFGGPWTEQIYIASTV